MAEGSPSPRFWHLQKIQLIHNCLRVFTKLEGPALHCLWLFGCLVILDEVVSLEILRNACKDDTSQVRVVAGLMQHLLVEVLDESMMSIKLKIQIVPIFLLLSHHLGHRMQVCLAEKTQSCCYRLCVIHTGEEFLKLKEVKTIINTLAMNSESEAGRSSMNCW